MDKPNYKNPIFPTSVPSMMPDLLHDPSIRGEAFDQLLSNRGIRFLHKKATPCPNLVSLDGRGHDPTCPICDDAKMIYYKEKEIYGVFSQNSVEKMFEIQGTWEVGTAVVTFPVEYSDGEQAEFAQWDKLVIPDFEVRLYQLIEYKPTVGDIQKLRYPITNIDYIGYIENNILITLVKDINYEITLDGQIHWLTSIPYSNGIGKVLTISYYAHPVFNIINAIHELRVTQQLINGEKISKRLPQAWVIKRDFFTSPGESL